MVIGRNASINGAIFQIHKFVLLVFKKEKIDSPESIKIRFISRQSDGVAVAERSPAPPLAGLGERTLSSPKNEFVSNFLAPRVGLEPTTNSLHVLPHYCERGLYHRRVSASRYLVSTVPPRFARGRGPKSDEGFPRCYPSLWSGGSPISRNLQLGFLREAAYRQGAALPLSYRGMYSSRGIEYRRLGREDDRCVGPTAEYVERGKLYTVFVILTNLTLGVILPVCSSFARYIGKQNIFQGKLIQKFGGKCVVCGYNKYAGALDFHHLDPKTKTFALSVKGLSYSCDSLVS